MQHLPFSQGTSSDGDPGHIGPLNLGGGHSHSLVRLIIPVPQSLREVQEPKEFQGHQVPGTVYMSKAVDHNLINGAISNGCTCLLPGAFVTVTILFEDRPTCFKPPMAPVGPDIVTKKLLEDKFPPVQPGMEKTQSLSN